jgi:GNAT superfamily N-acetyltransferase
MIEQMFALVDSRLRPEPKEGVHEPRISGEMSSVLTPEASDSVVPSLESLMLVAGDAREEKQSAMRHRSWDAAISIRPYERNDKRAVVDLLEVLPALYPGGGEWLNARLDAAALGTARCSVAYLGGHAIGATIETPKNARRLKLSTIWVDPAVRGRGVGTALLSEATVRWAAEGRREVYVTSDLGVAPLLLSLIARFGFDPKAIEWSRYGPQRHEAIFSWTKRR